jgi:hypothetical protein
MLKLLATIASVLLLVQVAAYPKPHETPDASKQDAPISAASPTIPSRNSTPTFQPKPDEHIQADVRVTSAPGKDGYDKAAIGINAMLAAWGLAGIVVGVSTLLLIRSQIDEMRRQRGVMEHSLHAMARQGDLMENQLKEMRIQREETVHEMKRQVHQMDQQAGASNAAARAAEQSANAAFLQIQMMKAKERARLKIDKKRLELEEPLEAYWNLRAIIEICNVGAGRAYIISGEGNITIAKRDQEVSPESEYRTQLECVHGYIDPTGESMKESFYFFPPDNSVLSEYAHEISTGQLKIYLSGFIEYETVGARFRQNFNYDWRGPEDPSNFSAMLGVTHKPSNDWERITFGFWEQLSSQANDEVEIWAQKKSEK